MVCRSVIQCNSNQTIFRQGKQHFTAFGSKHVTRELYNSFAIFWGSYMYMDLLVYIFIDLFEKISIILLF